MRFETAYVVGIVGMCLASAGSVFAQDYKPGDQVVVVSDAHLTIQGGEKIEKVWPGLVLIVGAVEGKWLWLNNGKPGWLDRRHVIPFDRRAIERLTKMIAASPRSASLYSGRADIWQHLGEVDIALVDYNEAIRLNPSAAAYYNNRGTVWSTKGEYDKAIADYNEALRLYPKDAIFYNNRGRSWHRKHEYDKALADYNEAIRLSPKVASAYTNRGIVWKIKGEYGNAIADYNEATRLDPKYAMAYRSRGDVWYDKNEYDKAIADYNEALRINPKDLWAYNARGNAWKGKGEYDKAVADYNEAIRIDPNAAWIFANRAQAGKMKGEYDKAIADYREAIRIDPTNADFYNVQAWLLATYPDEKYRDGKTAIELATKACELTDWKNAGCIDTLAAAYAETGDFDNAVKWQTQAIELSPAIDKLEFQSRLDLYKSGEPYRERSDSDGLATSE